MWPAQLSLCQVLRSPEVHLQVEGASDRLVVTDAVCHVADVALQRQQEAGGLSTGAGGLSTGGQGVGLGWLPLQPPQDSVSPRRLAFFLT